MSTTTADAPAKRRLTRSEAKARTRAALLTAARQVFTRDAGPGVDDLDGPTALLVLLVIGAVFVLGGMYMVRRKDWPLKD